MPHVTSGSASYASRTRRRTRARKAVALRCRSATGGDDGRAAAQAHRDCRSRAGADAGRRCSPPPDTPGPPACRAPSGRRPAHGPGSSMPAPPGRPAGLVGADTCFRAPAGGPAPTGRRLIGSRPGRRPPRLARGRPLPRSRSRRSCAQAPARPPAPPCGFLLSTPGPWASCGARQEIPQPSPLRCAPLTPRAGTVSVLSVRTLIGGEVGIVAQARSWLSSRPCARRARSSCPVEPHPRALPQGAPGCRGAPGTTRVRPWTCGARLSNGPAAAYARTPRRDVELIHETAGTDPRWSNRTTARTCGRSRR